ncbi:MAG: Bug family tripartite tricarboxylate transporter substrate binding protein [Clostridia bacterium]
MNPLIRVLAVVLLAATASAHADQWPSKPIRYIAVFPPGGPTDILARLISPRLGQALGQPVVVENRPGLAGGIGSAVLAKSAPDGYTIGGATSSSHAINAALYPNLNYDPVKDFAPITVLATYPNVLVVNAKLHVDTVGDLIALLKANPDKYSFGSGGSGTGEHLAGELFKMAADVHIEHIPYKGSGVLMPDLISGVVPMSFLNILAVAPQVRSGRLHALAVMSEARSPALPDVPSITEAGLPPECALQGWQALFAPAGTPKEIVGRLYSEVARILKEPEVAQRIRDLGAEPGGMAPQALGELIRNDIQRYAKIVHASGAHAD